MRDIIASVAGELTPGEIGERIRYRGKHLFIMKRLMLRLLRIDAIEIGDRFSVECYRRLLRIDAIEIGDRFSVEVHIFSYFFAIK